MTLGQYHVVCQNDFRTAACCMCTYISDALEDLFIDGVLELHTSIEGISLIVLNQLCETVKLGRAYHVVAILNNNTTVTNFALRSGMGGGIEASYCVSVTSIAWENTTNTSTTKQQDQIKPVFPKLSS